MGGADTMKCTDDNNCKSKCCSNDDAKCAGNDCPPTHYQVESKLAESVKDKIPDDRDAMCCKKLPTCSDHTCPAGYEKKQGKDAVPCATKDVASCSTNTCCSAVSTKC